MTSDGLRDIFFENIHYKLHELVTTIIILEKCLPGDRDLAENLTDLFRCDRFSDSKTKTDKNNLPEEKENSTLNMILESLCLLKKGEAGNFQIPETLSKISQSETLPRSPPRPPSTSLLVSLPPPLSLPFSFLSYPLPAPIPLPSLSPSRPLPLPLLLPKGFSSPPPQSIEFKNLQKIAESKLLTASEIFNFLVNFEGGEFLLTKRAPQKPESGTLFLYDKKNTRSFRKDGHIWQKKKNGGSTVNETHVNLKINGTEVIACYYARKEDDDEFHRQIYFLLRKPQNGKHKNENLVLVQYLKTTENRRGGSKNLIRKEIEEKPQKEKKAEIEKEIEEIGDIRIESNEIRAEKTGIWPEKNGIRAANNKNWAEIIKFLPKTAEIRAQSSKIRAEKPEILSEINENRTESDKIWVVKARILAESNEITSETTDSWVPIKSTDSWIPNYPSDEEDKISDQGSDSDSPYSKTDEASKSDSTRPLKRPKIASFLRNEK